MSDYRFSFVTFLSDFGLSDEFVGVCHGVMLGIAPDLRIIDINHGITPQNIREGAMVLAQSVSYMPAAIHVAVVDPGVGSSRLPVVVATKSGSLLVGPDNGLLALAANRLGGWIAAHKLENPELMLPKPARTFQARDVFSPAAAHLARGVPLEEFGDEVPVESLVTEAIPAARRHDDHLHGVVLHIDRFGNLQLNLTPSELEELALKPGELLEVRIEGQRKLVNFGETYGTVRPGELVVTEDSYGLISVAVNQGKASDRFAASLGSTVIVGAPGSGAGE